ncbi:carboxylesterase/lipase family protein [Pedobacter mucosus]|uniref:carboxylesterase/lipase family protein n=1 Tax=Pedobacter mucosus TaxID=2895286 RepID=UPI001EE3E181|nr:carboxylesterase family protein [Pedobacter mucosus]UKT66134.1 carboxylesterase family protein [Pedobacter mucosus]
MKFPNIIKKALVFEKLIAITLLIFCMSVPATSQTAKSVIQVKVNEGTLEGQILKSGIQHFMGIPYAKPPVGNLRWKAPQQLTKWNGVRKAVKFGPRPIQKSGLLYEFRSDNMSEDCLYLNIWAANNSSQKPKPVYVFIHGGSFIHGDGSQPAYDGESMAKQGIIYVTINYRLGVFGFLAHPDLSRESQIGASGNYGLLDQVAALKWIKANIAAFGGDPDKITLGGESVGAQSVSAHMASPLSKGLFSAAIAESSSLLDTRKLIYSKAFAENLGLDFSKITKTSSLAQLRSLNAKQLLKLASKGDPRRFKPSIDGYFLNEFPLEVFENGRQAKVPLIVGWNADEVPAMAFYRLKKANPKNFQKKVQRIYGDNAKELLTYYPVTTKKEARLAGAKLASDWLINYGSWQLAEQHTKNSDVSVYRYLFTQPHPGLTPKAIKSGTFFQVLLKKLINKTITGSAFHAAEIEYALGNLDVQQNYAWKDDDYKVSKQMQGYFVNFIKTQNPNGLTETDLLNWPKVENGKPVKFMRLGTESRVETELDTNRTRFLLLRKIGIAD